MKQTHQKDALSLAHQKDALSVALMDQILGCHLNSKTATC